MSRKVPVILALLTVLGPASIDLYLPVLPALARDLGTSTSSAQLTMTTCLLGLALAHVAAGPISDRHGRRGPLIVGLIIFVLASAMCGLSTSITVLIAMRLVQGLAGAVGLVIAQAAGRDIYEGTRLTRYYGRIVVLSGLAATVAPVIGGQIATLLDWRGSLFVLAAIGAVILLAVLLGFRETLPIENKVTGGPPAASSPPRSFICRCPPRSARSSPLRLVPRQSRHRRPRSPWPTTRSSPVPHHPCSASPDSPQGPSPPPRRHRRTDDDGPSRRRHRCEHRPRGSGIRLARPQASQSEVG